MQATARPGPMRYWHVMDMLRKADRRQRPVRVSLRELVAARDRALAQARIAQRTDDLTPAQIRHLIRWEPAGGLPVTMNMEPWNKEIEDMRIELREEPWRELNAQGGGYDTPAMAPTFSAMVPVLGAFLVAFLLIIRLTEKCLIALAVRTSDPPRPPPPPPYSADPPPPPARPKPPPYSVEPPALATTEPKDEIQIDPTDLHTLDTGQQQPLLPPNLDRVSGAAPHHMAPGSPAIRTLRIENLGDPFERSPTPRSTDSQFYYV